jgi:hypothetical protein
VATACNSSLRQMSSTPAYWVCVLNSALRLIEWIVIYGADFTAEIEEFGWEEKCWTSSYLSTIRCTSIDKINRTETRATDSVASRICACTVRQLVRAVFLSVSPTSGTGCCVANVSDAAVVGSMFVMSELRVLSTTIALSTIPIRSADHLHGSIAQNPCPIFAPLVAKSGFRWPQLACDHLVNSLERSNGVMPGPQPKKYETKNRPLQPGKVSGKGAP